MIIWNNDNQNSTPFYTKLCDCSVFDSIQIQFTALGINCDDRISLEDVEFDKCGNYIILRPDLTTVPAGQYDISILGFDTSIPDVVCEIYVSIIQINDVTICT
jgi:hypothetical protein